MDELCGSDAKQLVRQAEEWEARYLNALPKPGKDSLVPHAGDTCP